ncbi:MAG: DUF2190 family protein [Proteobacteria bacterium]|nr:DUF2190 family protein [Pseudomonadota bacterium]MCL2306735.1 DUF2190 family protein [Pseudomonadota bacterium]
MQARPVWVDTVVATTEITEYAPVTYDGKLATDSCVVKGVAQTSAAINDTVAVAVLGSSQVFITEAVVAGDLLEPDGTGKVRKAAGDAGFARANRNGTAGTRIEAVLLPR